MLTGGEAIQAVVNTLHWTDVMLSDRKPAQSRTPHEGHVHDRSEASGRHQADRKSHQNQRAKAAGGIGPSACAELRV